MHDISIILPLRNEENYVPGLINSLSNLDTKDYSIEFIFIIVGSFIVFTSQPLNWIVALILFSHLMSVAWIITNPDSFYSVLEQNHIDTDSLEVTSALIVFGYGVFVYFSFIFIT